MRAALKNAEDKGLPHEIAVPAEQGKLLQLLATSIRAKRILEIGTLGGYVLHNDHRILTVNRSPA